MRFEWDEQKRKTNIRKHGFDFRDAWKVFNSPLLVGPDDRYDYGEERSACLRAERLSSYSQNAMMISSISFQ